MSEPVYRLSRNFSFPLSCHAGLCLQRQLRKNNHPDSILPKSIWDRYRPDRIPAPVGPITVTYRFKRSANWAYTVQQKNKKWIIKAILVTLKIEYRLSRC